MSRLVQSVLLMLLGGVLLAVTVSGRFTNYVRPAFQIPLLLGGAVLVAAGLISLVVLLRGERRTAPAAAHDDSDDGARPDDHTDAEAAALDAHGHAHSSRAPWLILAPVLVLLLAPPALGANAASHDAGSQAIAGLTPVGADQAVTGDGGYAPNDGLGTVGGPVSNANGVFTATMAFPSLPAGPAPELTIREFVQRSLYDPTGAVIHHPITITGFLTPPGDGYSDGFSVARMVISCCAADAQAVRVHVEEPQPYPDNTWVTAVVEALPATATAGNDYVPTVRVLSLNKIVQPGDPYEH